MYALGVVLTAILPLCWCGGKNVPVGHLQPLGSHKSPSVIIDEFTKENAPDPKTFFEEYVKPSKAAIFRGVLKDSDAYNLWTDGYIRKNFGDLEVRLEAKHEKKHRTPIGEKYLGRDNLRHFTDHYHDSKSKTYIVSELPSPMYHDFEVIPSLGACGEMSRRFVEIDIWWSGGNSKSLLHKDAFNQMNCLLNGTKYWKLIEYKYEKYVHKHPEPSNEIGGFSDVNVDAVNLIKHPNIAKTEWSNFTIHTGDCLFLPRSCYHQVTSTGTHNLAVSILFSRFDNRESLDFSDCNENTDYQRGKRLSELDVQWIWNGSGVMSMGRSDLEEQFRTELLHIAATVEKKGKRFTSKAFINIFGSGGQKEDQKLRTGDAKKAFNLIDSDNDGAITEDEVKAMTTAELRQFATEIEPYEPSNTYDFEYSFISYDIVLDTLKQALKQKNKLSRTEWVSLYMKVLGGTESFANQIFTRLSGSEDENTIVSKDITKKDIAHALEKWIFYWVPQYSGLRKRPDQKEEEGGRKSADNNDDMDEEDQEDGDADEFEDQEDEIPGYEVDEEEEILFEEEDNFKDEL